MGRPSASRRGRPLMGPGCAKTSAFNLLIESSSQFGQSKNQSAGDGYPKKVIEKTVLRFLGSRTFSHGLAPQRPFASVDSNAGQCPCADVAKARVEGRTGSA